MQDALVKLRTIKDWESVTSHASGIKLLNPSLDLGLTKEDWQGMQDELARYRIKRDWYNIPRHALHMKILAAEKVEITDQGLKLTMPKRKAELKGQTPPIPERRRFQ